MSGCGKKGGIPKSFHNDYGLEWAKNAPNIKYSTWIAARWQLMKKEPNGIPKKYTKDRGLNKNKCKARTKYVNPRKWAIGEKWVSRYSKEPLEKGKVQQAVRLFRLCKRKWGGTLTKIQTRDFMKENQELFTHAGLVCFELKKNGQTCYDPQSKKGAKDGFWMWQLDLKGNDLETLFMKKTGRSLKSTNEGLFSMLGLVPQAKQEVKIEGLPGSDRYHPPPDFRGEGPDQMNFLNGSWYITWHGVDDFVFNPQRQVWEEFNQ